MKKLTLNQKYILYTVLAFTISLFLSGCGLPKEYIFNSEKEFYSINASEIKEVFNVLESNNWNSIYKDHNDKKYYYSIKKGKEDDVLLSDKFPNIEQIFSKLDISSLYKSRNGDIILITNHNGSYFKSYKDIKNIECPHYFGVSENDLNKPNIEKTIDGDKIHFIADHRKDKESTWQGMYYRIDVEKLDTNIYTYEVQTKYPWTSIFSA